jgi:hypothetical protein
VLFRIHSTLDATNYDVLPGGGFVMLRSLGEDDLTVMVNWTTEINQARAAQR